MNGQSGNLEATHLQSVITELCGQIPPHDSEYIVDKTFTVFGINRDESVPEETFVEVRFSNCIFI